jgi:hypothetical protein
MAILQLEVSTSVIAIPQLFKDMLLRNYDSASLPQNYLSTITRHQVRSLSVTSAIFQAVS